jgi:4-azaleucine resistance transporter AzlC
MTPWGDVRAGFLAVAPAIPANVAFGLVTGVAILETGLTGVEGVAMSALWFAGAAQLAALDLLQGNAPIAVVVLTALVVNARYVMYSAAISPYLEQFSRPSRWAAAFFLLDITFALSVTAFETDTDRDELAYYLGTAVPLWVVWVASTATGVLLGAGIPPAWGIDFAIPLVFLALLAPSIDGRASIVAAAIGGLGTTIGTGIPFNLGLVIAALCGVVVAVLVEDSGVGVSG